MPYADKSRAKRRHAEYQKRRYHEKRTKVLRHLGGECVVCGEADDLEIHHKDLNSKEFDVGEFWDYPWERLVAELAKCELRCRKHHLAVHSAFHGSPGMYRHQKCRCEVCCKANSDLMKKYRANRKSMGARSSDG